MILNVLSFLNVRKNFLDRLPEMYSSAFTTAIYIHFISIFFLHHKKILRMTYNVQPYYRLYSYHFGLAVKCKMMYKLPCTVLYCQTENVILPRHISHRKFWGRIIIHKGTKGYLFIILDQCKVQILCTICTVQYTTVTYKMVFYTDISVTEKSEDKILFTTALQPTQLSYWIGCIFQFLVPYVL
jgi:hypothetical protein